MRISLPIIKVPFWVVIIVTIVILNVVMLTLLDAAPPVKHASPLTERPAREEGPCD